MAVEPQRVARPRGQHPDTGAAERAFPSPVLRSIAPGIRRIPRKADLLKLGIYSDLHLGRGDFAVPPTPVDVVILAGDIARPREAIAWAARLGKPVVYVAGNHEFYDSSIAAATRELRELCRGTDIRFLEQDEVVIQGVRFLGTTLWTDFMLFDDASTRDAAITAAKSYMRDFQVIRAGPDAERLFTPEDAAAIWHDSAQWLASRLATPHPGPTIVVTHHAPSPRSIHARFADSLINICFVSRAEHLLDGRAALWVHGHTHDSFDYVVNGTRVVCNPRGYAQGGTNENRVFDPALIVTVG